ncbi:MAG: hypothetical protein FJ280_12350 [Planctomycetes bacterium]|nr:hypothetical protein [Planctomycetota bacterium]
MPLQPTPLKLKTSLLMLGVILPGLTAWGSPALAQAPAPRAPGPLRVHPTNPRYFTDGTKNPDGSLRAVYLTGSHTWNSLQDGAFFTTENADPPPRFDFEAYLDFLERHNHNFIRLWRFEQPKFHYWLDADSSVLRTTTSRRGLQFSQPHPWARTGPGADMIGKLKFDLTQFDREYFDRLRSRVIAARERGMYVSVMLFEGGSMRRGNRAFWSAHPFKGGNNVNGIKVPDDDGDEFGPQVQSLLVPAVTELQKTYIRHVVDTVNDLDNVLYEVGNEFEFTAANTEWQHWVVKFVKDYEATKPKQHPVGMVCQMHHPWKTSVPDDPRNAVLFNGPADWISPGGYAGRGYINPETIPAADGKKVLLFDTDHVWGVGGADQAWVWQTFTRGHNPLFMDFLSEITEHVVWYRQAPEVRAAMGHTRSYAMKMNLAAMTPRDDLASTRYCLANPGKEYLIYLPDGGEVTVDLSAVPGQFAQEWFNPKSGSSTAGKVLSAGARRACQAPFTGQAVLYLKAQSSKP